MNFPAVVSCMKQYLFNCDRFGPILSVSCIPSDSTDSDIIAQMNSGSFGLTGGNINI